MKKYDYTARDESGELMSGVIEALNTDNARDKIAERGLYPITVKSKGLSLRLPRFVSKSVPAKNLIVMTRQFYTMFKAGVPMAGILEALARQSSHPGLKTALKQIELDLSQGTSLEVAFSRHPQHFNKLFTSMLGVGEVGGVLEQTLNEISKVLYSESRVETQVKSATLYPKIVSVVLVIVFVVMMVMVIPVFAQFYAHYDAALPIPTQIAIWISNTFINSWHIVIFLGLFCWALFKKYSLSKKGRFLLDRLKFEIPIFGHLNMMVVNSRFSHLLSSLYRSGLPISKSFTVISKTIENVVYAKAVDDIKEAVERGESLSVAMGRSRFFSPMVVEVTAIGEQSGSIDELLESVASFYDEEIDDMMKNFNTILEPALLFIVFLFVAFLAFAVFLPAWNLTNVVLPG